MRKLLSRADHLFLLLAIPFSIGFSLLIPPFGGGDEQHHYHRTAEIAYAHLLSRKTPVPAGIVEFRQRAYTLYFATHPDGYSRLEYQRLAAISLSADRTDTLRVNIFTVHHPLNYLAQSIAFRVAAELGARPLVLLYVARIAGMLVGILLVWLAIRVMPAQQYAMAAIALLPTAVTSHSTLNADAVTDGIALLFIALAVRAIVRKTPMTGRETGALALTAIGIACCKGAYIPLALLTLAIPRDRFSSGRHRAAALAACVLPAVIGGLGWMLTVKQYLFTGIQHTTLAGQPAPDRQLAFILHDPGGYLRVLHHTLFETPFLSTAARGLFGEFSHGNLHFPEWAYAMIGTAFVATILLDQTADGVTYGRPARAISFGVFLACFFGAITLLYLQWCSVRAPVISGFQGRYLTPVLPLLVVAASPRLSATPTNAGIALIVLGIGGLSTAALAILVALFGI